MTGQIGAVSICRQALYRGVAALRNAIHELTADRGSIEAALSRYEQRECMLTAAVEAAKCPIIIMSLDGTITALNAAARQLYNRTAAEAIGRNIDIIIPPERRLEHRILLDKVRSGEPIDTIETTRMTK